MAKITGNADQDSDGYGALYGGPRSGQPQDDATDLHDNPNPFAAGSPSVDREGTSAYPIVPGGLPGYYMNPPAAGGDNPFRNGVTEDVIPGISLDDLYADVMGSRVANGGDGTNPSAGDVYNDEGYGKSGQGRS